MDDFLNYSSANQAIANQARARHEAVTSSLLLPDEWRLLLPDNGIDLRAIVGIPHPAEIRHGRHSAADPPVLIAVVALAAALAMAVLLNRARLPALRQSMDAGAAAISSAAPAQRIAECNGANLSAFLVRRLHGRSRRGGRPSGYGASAC